MIQQTALCIDYCPSLPWGISHKFIGRFQFFFLISLTMEKAPKQHHKPHAGPKAEKKKKHTKNLQKNNPKVRRG
jgi:hypothetical protein